MKQNPKNRGSLGGEMRIKTHCRNLSNHTKSNYMYAVKTFDAWRKNVGLSNRYIRENPREAVGQIYGSGDRLQSLVGGKTSW